MTLRKSLQVRNAVLKDCLDRRNVVMQGFTDSTRAYLDRAFQEWVDEQDAQYARDSDQCQATETGLADPQE